MSDTPETDGIVEQCYRQINVPTNPVPVDFARKLERERNEYRKLADDAMATLHEIKVKYGLGERHVMREKDREIEKLHKIIDEMEILASWLG